ncbi:FMRFamide receptor-like [Haliotis cracherodii]|uniref:FMRFamide receptor-like n=1 Tax=Haliotis cracherodii TaxID=6455 RepID=UPI0039EB2EAD
MTNCTVTCYNSTDGRQVDIQSEAEIFASVMITLTILGVGGNILCLVVLLRVQQTVKGTRLLKHLSITEIFALVLCLLSKTLPDFITARHIYTSLKPFVSPLSFTVYTYEIYLTVLIAMQRALALTKPLMFDIYVHKSTINKMLIFLGIASIALSVPHWIALSPQLYFDQELNRTWLHANGNPFRTSYGYSVFYSGYVTFIVQCFIPVIALTISNSCLIYSRIQMTRRSVLPNDNGKKLIVVVIAITSISLVTHLISAAAMLFQENPYSLRLKDLFIVVKLSINFVFYSLFGRAFRATLLIVCGVTKSSVIGKTADVTSI